MHRPLTGIDWLRRQIASHTYALAVGTLTALLVLAAVLFDDLQQPFAFAAALLVPSQVCLIALWATLSTTHAAVRLGRAFLWTGGLYFCILGPASLQPAKLPSVWPQWLALVIGGMIVGTSLSAAVVRRYGWRLVSASSVRDPPAPERRPHQFRLADALAWITMVCVFLALGVMTVSRFAAGESVPFVSDLRMLRSALASGACVALGVGAIATLICWLVLVDSKSCGWFFQKYWRILLVLLVVALWLDRGGSFGMGPPPFAMVLTLAVGFGLPMAVSSQMLRIYGWNLVRVGVSTSVPSAR
ncbi:MAG TPA: hypothetical protein VFB96_01140 [Pirellulaceae bacterium]|nr:hypothetical protein [Pirellulaceae bacterium]